MKPYGKKKSKTKLGLHNSDKCHCELCNTFGWKIFKSRERHNNEAVDEFFNSKEITPYDELERIVLQRYEDGVPCHTEGWGDETFVARYNPLGIEVVGVTPEHAMDKLANKLYKTNEKT